MRSLRQTIPYAAWPSMRDARGRLLGLPFVLAAFVPGFVLGWQACLTALTIASRAYILNNGHVVFDGTSAQLTALDQEMPCFRLVGE